MKRKELEAKRDEVIGLIPVYTDRGNTSKVLLKTGEIIDEIRTLKAVKDNLARTYAIDLKAQRQYIGKILNRQGALPFYIGQRVFINLKIRKSIARADTVYGYIDINYIQAIEPKDAELRCQLLLTTGQTYDLVSRYATAIKSKESGERLLAYLSEASQHNKADEEIYSSVISLIGNLKEISQSLERIESKIAENGIEWDP